MDEVTKLLAEIKEDLQRKDETFQLIADSKPDEKCRCTSCTQKRILGLLEQLQKEGGN